MVWVGGDLGARPVPTPCKCTVPTKLISFLEPVSTFLSDLLESFLVFCFFSESGKPQISEEQKGDNVTSLGG